jgi:hypothetical protein
MATTTNFGWTTPDDTDLVKDGAAAIRTLGSSIDTSLVDLKGGTTGQVLTKASNTDLDFSFTTPASLPITTEGDLIIGDASGDAVRLPIGALGTVLTSDGDTADWAAPSSGGMTLISTTSLSGAAIALTSIPQTYNDLRIVISGASNGTGEDDITCLRFNNNSTSNIYRRIATGVEDGTATSQGNQGAQVRLSIQAIDAGTTNSLLVIDVPNYTSSTTNKVGFCLNSYTTGVSGTKRSEEVAFSFDNTTAITEVNLLTLNAYNWDNGTVYLYGVK